MADNKKYYYLKLKENFFDSDEIKILEAMPNGFLYSNLLLKLYLKSLKFNGALRVNEYIPYNEEMIAAITNLNIDVVRTGLAVLSQMKLVEKLDNGTIYMSNIQQFIGKSSTEADRKRLYRQEIDEKKLELEQSEEEGQGQMSDQCPNNVRTNSDECSRENRDKRLEIRDKSIERERENNNSLSKESFEICSYYEKLTSRSIVTKIQLIEELVKMYSFEWVKDAVEKAVFMNKVSISYVQGILRNWTVEGKEEKKKVGGKGGNSGTDLGEELRQQGIGL